jgi:hypothetical protein
MDPNGVAVDSSGNVYIADTANCRVREVNAGTGAIATVFGGPSCAGAPADSGPAVGAGAYDISDVAVDHSGAVIVVDEGYRRVLEVQGGTFRLVAGGWGAAYGTGDGQLATYAGLDGPYGAAFDVLGNLYIADTFDERVRMVNAVDRDNDGLPDWVETGTGTYIGPTNTGTNPLKADTDGDGYSDGREVTLGKNPLTYCAIMRADLNGDGVVNGIDLAAFALDFTKSVPPANARTDQNGDGVINGIDLALFATHFLQPVAACP